MTTPTPNPIAAPPCEICGNPALLKKDGKYSATCSVTCNSTRSSRLGKEKREATSLAKWGVTHYSKSQEYADRLAANKAAGVVLPQQTEEYKERMRQYYQEHHGVDNPSQLQEVKDKKVATSLKNYGVPHPRQNEAVVEKSLETVRKKYGVEFPGQIPAARAKKRKTWQKKYGMNPARRHIDPAVIERLCNREWLEAEHSTKSLMQISEETGVTLPTIRRYINMHNIEITRHSRRTWATKLEEQVVDWLNELGIEHKRNDRTIIKPYELDIVFRDKKIALELDGNYWHCEVASEGRCGSRYHLNKTIAAEKEGYQCIHIPEYLWDTRQDQVKSMILHKLGMADVRIGARKTRVVTLSSKVANSYLDEWHVSGGIPSSGGYGLEFEGELVAVATYTKARFDKSFGGIELLRFATKPGVAVVGGLSKLAKQLRQHGPILSYADRRWSNGDGYKAAGFELVSTSAPGYWYTNDYKTFAHRVRFQKHKLRDYPGFDPGRSEWENMQEFGYDRVWDCGNLKFVLQ